MRRTLAIAAAAGILLPAGAAAAPATKPACKAGKQAVKHRTKAVRKKTVRTSSGRRKVVRVVSWRTTWRCRMPVSAPRPAAPAPSGVLPPGEAGAPVAAPPVVAAVPVLPSASPPAGMPDVLAPADGDKGPGGALTVVARDPDAPTLPGWAFTASRATVPRGPVTVDFVNRGGDPHDLWFRRSSGAVQRIAPMTAADTGEGPGLERATVRLATGTITLFCAVGGHEALGMKATLVVE